MSLRKLLSWVLPPYSDNSNISKQDTARLLLNPQRPQRRVWHRLVLFFILVALVLSAVWLLMAIWYQLGIYSLITWTMTALVMGLVSALFGLGYAPKILPKKIMTRMGMVTAHTAHSDKGYIDKSPLNKAVAVRWLTGIYASIWLLGVGWFLSLTPQQERNWMADVSQRLSYTRDASNPDLITLTKVRNFDWYRIETADVDGVDEIAARERWETRTIDMSKLSGVDVINSYWMGPLIAHTLVSFRFENDRPLSFSLEIRKEEEESFSAFAGFFRRFELSLIAAEERDIIYTRANVRGEQVYLFPISHLRQQEVKALFESYLTMADNLDAQPAWYNTLTDNCTNIIFYMARMVSGERLPWDYRIWVSGWLPNYLYDIGMLDATGASNAEQWSMQTWYERAHINPKVIGFDNPFGVDNAAFSERIRQDIPLPLLADTVTDADTP